MSEREQANVERARRIADAILYEGYVLYPYRASSRKNRYRWTFGVVAPRLWTAAGGCEPASATLECLVETRDGALPTPMPTIDGMLRFLHVERRTVEALDTEGTYRPVASLRADGEEHITWEDGVERELPFTIAVPLNGARVVETTLPAGSMRASSPTAACRWAGSCASSSRCRSS